MKRKNDPKTNEELIEILKDHAPLIIAAVLLIYGLWFLYYLPYEDLIAAYAIFIISGLFILIWLGSRK